MTKRKLLYVLGSIAAACGLLAGVTYAAFTDSGKVLGSTFSTGSADLKFLSDVTAGNNPANLTDELTGPSFANISPTWTKDYLIKLINNGTSKLALTTQSDYTTANDPKSLRSNITAEIIKWNDSDSDGVLDTGEESENLGTKTIIKWKTEGFDLGELESGQTLSLIVRFTAPTLTGTQQGSTGIFDFLFDAIQL